MKFIALLVQFLPLGSNRTTELVQQSVNQFRFRLIRKSLLECADSRVSLMINVTETLNRFGTTLYPPSQ